MCDRFYDSTIAYWGYGRGLDLAMLQGITAFAVKHLKPDLTFLLDLDVEAGLLRRERGDVEINRMDLQARSFYEQVRQRLSRIGGHRAGALGYCQRIIGRLKSFKPIYALR